MDTKILYCKKKFSVAMTLFLLGLTCVCIHVHNMYLISEKSIQNK